MHSKKRKKEASKKKLDREEKKHFAVKQKIKKEVNELKDYENKFNVSNFFFSLFF